MKAGDVIDLTLRSMRVVDVKPGSTLLVGSLPNGEPFEVRVPFDADVRTAPVERPTAVDCGFEWPDEVAAELANDPHVCLRRPGHDGGHKCHCGADMPDVRCASTLSDPGGEWGDHRCALYVDAGPHTDCRHICECGKQWGGA